MNICPDSLPGNTTRAWDSFTNEILVSMAKKQGNPWVHSLELRCTGHSTTIFR